jgi:hypothetical protein
MGVVYHQNAFREDPRLFFRTVLMAGILSLTMEDVTDWLPGDPRERGSMP